MSVWLLAVYRSALADSFSPFYFVTVQEFVIFLSLALGAGSITVASAPKKLDTFDFIIIRDNTPVPPELEELNEGSVVDEEWVKQSVIVGCQVRPSTVLSYAVQKRWPKADGRILWWDYAGRTKALEAGPGSEDGSKESVIQAVSKLSRRLFLFRFCLFSLLVL